MKHEVALIAAQLITSNPRKYDDVSGRKLAVEHALDLIKYTEEQREVEKSFMAADLPDRTTHCHQSECGFSIYKGVLVQWDEDHDKRILELLDIITKDILQELVVVQEHEGMVFFVWKSSIPKRFESGKEIEVAGDHWTIQSSIARPVRVK